MAQIIGLYSGNPTEGSQNGVLVSTRGDNTNPIYPQPVALEEGAESSPIKLAVRLISAGDTKFINDDKLTVYPFRQTTVKKTIVVGLSDLFGYLTFDDFAMSFDCIKNSNFPKVTIGTKIYTIDYEKVGEVWHCVLVNPATIQEQHEQGEAVKLVDFDRWALALDKGGVPDVFKPWGEPLVFDKATVKELNRCFWTKTRYKAGDVIGYNRMGYIEAECLNIIPQV